MKRIYGWSKKEIQVLRRLFPTHTSAEIALKLNCTKCRVKRQAGILGLKKPATFASQFQQRNPGGRAALAAGRVARTQPGTVAWLRGGGNSLEHEWHIYRGRGHPIALKRYLWEVHVGPIPAGYVVRYRDGNPKRCVLGNLECISRKDHAARNIDREKGSATIREGRAKDSYYASRLFMKDREMSAFALEYAPNLIEAYKSTRSLTNQIIHVEQKG